MNVIIEPLQRDKHHRLNFSCGKEPLDRFLHENAHQALQKNLSKTYVAVDDADQTVILGYYTVTACRVEASDLPDEVVRRNRLPHKDDLPGSLVARLAVAERIKGQGIGSLLLMDALARCGRVASNVGGVAVVVDAFEESVVAFYEQYGFRRFEPGSLKMFMMMATVHTLVGLPEEQREVG